MSMSIRNGQARWAFDLSTWRPSFDELLLATSCVQTEERIRLEKYTYRDEFDASIIGRLMARKFIHEATQIPYEQIRILKDKTGRPHLSPEQQNLCDIHVDFNVSHNGSYTVLAGCCSSSDNNSPTKIGVDLMQIEYCGGRKLHEFFGLMSRNFSADEWRYIRSYEEQEDALEAFMRNWCLKESYAKNMGLQIRENLQEIEFSINTNLLWINKIVTDTTLTEDCEEMNNWIFEESLIDLDHCVAVAVKNPMDSHKSHIFDMVTFDDIMRDATPVLDYDYEYCIELLERPYINT